MKTTTISVILFALLFLSACSSTKNSSGINEDIVILTGTFVKEDGTPASKVRIDVFEIGKNGTVGSYNATVAKTSEGGMELIFQCPGTGVTDVNGKLVCNVDLSKFDTSEKRFTLSAQCPDPLKPGTSKILQLRPEKSGANLKVTYGINKINLDDVVGKIVVLGM